MLRKQILTTHRTISGRGAAEKDIAAVATVLISSEDPRHPIDYAFDGQRGPGASRWIAAQSGEQTLILAFDTPQTIRKILVEVEEREISRTQEMAVSLSQDGGADLSRNHASGVQLQPARDDARARRVVDKRRGSQPLASTDQTGQRR